MTSDRPVAPALKDALATSYTVDAFNSLYRRAVGYRDIARAALAALHAGQRRIAALEDQLSTARDELRTVRAAGKADAA